MIGRKEEIGVFKATMNSEQSEFIAVYGRRRVGKTYLIRQTFDNHFSFYHTGLARATMAEQLEAFGDALEEYGLRDFERPRNWLAAFRLLKKLLAESHEPRKVVFIDEMPWMDTPRSRFLTALEHFWNSWASARTDIELVICGSATSWILTKVIHNRGGLHNRVTRRIHLKPFTLAECEQYAQSRNLGFSRSQIAEAYMVLGGVPFYWSFLLPGQSLAQNLDRMLFSLDGEMYGEFNELYASLFRHKDCYVKLVQLIVSRKGGITREEIVANGEFPNSGRLTQRLEELEQCGFIRSSHVIGRCASDKVYQLIDNFSLFYFDFIRENTHHDDHFWTNSLGSGLYHAWRGLAFERLCLQHVPEIKRALGIAGVAAEVGCWYHHADAVYPHGLQIDLVFDRRDQTVNLFEMKCTNDPYRIEREESQNLNYRVEGFRKVTGTKSSIHMTMVSMNGVEQNTYSGDVQKVLTLEDLF